MAIYTKLCLRELNSPYGDMCRNSTLSFADLDQNFIYLKGELVKSAIIENGVLILTKINNHTLEVDLSVLTESSEEALRVMADENEEIKNNFNNDVTNINTTINEFKTDVENNSVWEWVDGRKNEVKIKDSGNTDTIVYAPKLNINIEPANDNSLTQVLVRDEEGNVKYKDIKSFTDLNVVNGVYDIKSGIVTLTNNEGGSFEISGFTSGMTDSYTDEAYLEDKTIYFNNNIKGDKVYSVDISPILNDVIDSIGLNDRGECSIKSYNEYQALAENYTNAKNEYDTIQTSKQEIDTNIAELKVLITTAETKVNEYRTEKNTLETNLFNLEAERNDLMQQLDDLINAPGEDLFDRAKAMSAADELIGSVDNIGTTISQKGEMTDAEFFATYYESIDADLSAALSTLQYIDNLIITNVSGDYIGKTQLRNIIAEINVLIKRMRGFLENGEYQNLKSRQAQLRVKVEELRDGIESVEFPSPDNSDAIAALEQQIQVLNQQIQDIKVQIQIITEQIVSLDQQLSIYHTQRESYIKDSARYEEQIQIIEVSGDLEFISFMPVNEVNFNCWLRYEIIKSVGYEDRGECSYKMYALYEELYRKSLKEQESIKQLESEKAQAQEIRNQEHANYISEKNQLESDLSNKQDELNVLKQIVNPTQEELNQIAILEEQIAYIESQLKELTANEEESVKSYTQHISFLDEQINQWYNTSLRADESGYEFFEKYTPLNEANFTCWRDVYFHEIQEDEINSIITNIGYNDRGDCSTKSYTDYQAHAENYTNTKKVYDELQSNKQQLEEQIAYLKSQLVNATTQEERDILNTQIQQNEEDLKQTIEQIETIKASGDLEFVEYMPVNEVNFNCWVNAEQTDFLFNEINITNNNVTEQVEIIYKNINDVVENVGYNDRGDCSTKSYTEYESYAQEYTNTKKVYDELQSNKQQLESTIADLQSQLADAQSQVPVDQQVVAVLQENIAKNQDDLIQTLKQIKEIEASGDLDFVSYMPVNEANFNCWVNSLQDIRIEEVSKSVEVGNGNITNLFNSYTSTTQTTLEDFDKEIQSNNSDIKEVGESLDKHIHDTSNPHQTSFNNLTSTAHTHTISDVIGLQNNLDDINKAVSSNDEDIDQLGEETAQNSEIINEHIDDTNNPHQTSFNNLTTTAHTHTISDITNLQSNLDDINKAVSSNDEDIDKLNDSLSNHIKDTNNPHQTSFDNLTSTAHTHTISDVIGLQNELDDINKSILSIDDVYVNQGSVDALNQKLTFKNTNGVTFEVTNAAALFTDNDIHVVSGVYNPSTGIVTYTTNVGTAFGVSGFTTGMTDSYTTAANLNGETIEFDNNIKGGNLYNVDLSSMLQPLKERLEKLENAEDADTFTESSQLNSNTLNFTRNDGVIYGVDLSPLLKELTGRVGNLENAEDANTYTTSANLDGNVINFTGTDELSYSVDLSSLTDDLSGRVGNLENAEDADTFTQSASLSNNTLTFTRNDSQTYSVNLSSLQSPDNDWVVNDNNMYSIPSGNVGIGTSSPSQKLEVDGVTKSDVFALYNTYHTRIISPEGAEFSNGGNNDPGRIKITAPQTISSNGPATQFRATIKVIEDGHAFDVHVSCYIQNETKMHWHHAWIDSPPDGNNKYNFNVRFYYDASNKFTISIGEDTDTWRFLKVVVTDVILGVSNRGINDWATGWNIELDNYLDETDGVLKAVLDNEISTNGKYDIKTISATQANNWGKVGNTLKYDSGNVNITNGTLTINNNYTFPLTDGTNGQVLKTDGGGNVTWENDTNTDTFTQSASFNNNTNTITFTRNNNQTYDVDLSSLNSSDNDWNVNGNNMYSLPSGNVGIGTTTPTQKLEVDGGILADSLSTTWSTGRAGNTRILSPGGGSYSVDGGTTGAFIITLPQGGSNTMISMSVKIFDYTKNEHITLNIAGYAIPIGNATYTSAWIRQSAWIEGSSNDEHNFKVRFTYDHVKDKNVIIIGEKNSAWSYPDINIIDVQVGYDNSTPDKWNNGWEIELSTDWDTIMYDDGGVSKRRYVEPDAEHGIIENTQVHNWIRNNDNSIQYGSGNVNITNSKTLTINDYTFPASKGTDGQVLKTDGNGNLTWQSSSDSNQQNQINSINSDIDSLQSESKLLMYRRLIVGQGRLNGGYSEWITGDPIVDFYWETETYNCDRFVQDVVTLKNTYPEGTYSVDTPDYTYADIEFTAPTNGHVMIVVEFDFQASDIDFDVRIGITDDIYNGFVRWSNVMNRSSKAFHNNSGQQDVRGSSKHEFILVGLTGGQSYRYWVKARNSRQTPFRFLSGADYDTSTFGDDSNVVITQSQPFTIKAYSIPSNRYKSNGTDSLPPENDGTSGGGYTDIGDINTREHGDLTDNTYQGDFNTLDPGDLTDTTDLGDTSVSG